MSWVEKITALLPVLHILLNVSSTIIRLSTSKNAVGSSSRIIWELLARPAAMQPFWNSPSLRVEMSLSARWLIPMDLRAVGASSFIMCDGFLWQARRMNSKSVKPGTLGVLDGTRLTSSLMDESVFNNVVFPLPFAPHSIMQSPELMSKLTLLYRTLSLCPIVRPFMSRSVSLSILCS